MKMVASAIHGAKKHDHACSAQPGEEMFRCTSPGWMPRKYRVDRWPTGYDACVCSTSFGRDVVPEVKESRHGSLIAVCGCLSGA